MSELSKAITLVRLVYGHEAGNALQELARLDEADAVAMAAAALDPKVIEEKHRIDASERKVAHERNH